DDEFGMTQSIKYGFTDDFFAELEVLEDDLGDGGNQGNGDLKLTAFYRIVRENGCMPAIATYATLRIPSGDGSSRVDGTLHGVVTKKINECFRAHLDGFIETANGDAGEDDRNRRHFQWGVGPGFDYQIDPCTTAVLNYLHKC